VAPKVWFITGTSSGLGREWAIAALERGDLVAGTARDTERLKDLAELYGSRMLPLSLEVKDRTDVLETVKRAHEHFGRLDVVVNNAGYGQLAGVEETTEELVRDMFETNFFGALWVTQAVLPILRDQGSGHILQVSSMAGLVGIPMLALYSASKWALEGMSEALAGETRGFGIKVTIIEPGGYRTGQAARPRPAGIPLPEYQPVRDEMMKQAAGNLSGDPAATRGAILAIVDAEEPPLRVLLGGGLLSGVETSYQSRLDNWRLWEPISESG
jgi:NAD(P)-dependent dehydrogenase (short-subunit alcohol dehydrogenase family)